MRLPPSLASVSPIIGFAIATALAAQLTVPMTPVPMTMQTFVILLAGAVLGTRRGFAAAGLYLVAAAVGLPVLSDGASGLQAFSGATAGYLWAFPVGAALVGVAAERGLLDRPATGFGLVVAAHLLILASGAAWLATAMGPSAALAHGFLPFLIGAAVKSALVLLARRGFIAGPRLGGGRTD